LVFAILSGGESNAPSSALEMRGPQELGFVVQLAGFLPRAVEWPIWMPMLAFELIFASWLIFTGMRPRNLTA
jgi:hypothetical protein